MVRNLPPEELELHLIVRRKLNERAYRDGVRPEPGLFRDRAQRPRHGFTQIIHKTKGKSLFTVKYLKWVITHISLTLLRIWHIIQM